jgi:hypothetical protein
MCFHFGIICLAGLPANGLSSQNYREDAMPRTEQITNMAQSTPARIAWATQQLRCPRDFRPVKAASISKCRR